MTRRKVLIVGMVSVALLTLLAMINFVYAQESGPQSVEAVLGTAFTYQGQLKNGETEVTGSCDMAFRLYDAVTVGNPIGTPITQTVAVNAGLFTTQLDFGASAFNGQARWLEIAVKCGSDATFTTLSRQALTAAPYALYATTAGSAPWSGLTSVPAGFTDGVDNDTTYTAGDGLELTGTQFKMKGTSYQNVVIVAKSGGDYTTISAALTSITGASATNHYLVKVMPGVYTETVTMKRYVDIEGAGESTTKITYAGSLGSNTGTVVGADDAELRFLTVENTGGSTIAIAIYNSYDSPRLTHVTATASGGTESNHGVHNQSSSSPAMTDVTATALGGGSSHGVYNTNSSSPMMTNVIATGSGGTNSYGVHNGYSSPTMRNVTATGSGGTNTNNGVYNEYSSPTMTNVTATGSEGTFSAGVYNINSSSPTMTNLTATGSEGTNSSIGVYNFNSSSPTMTNVTATGSGGTTNSYGVCNGSASSPMMMNVTATGSGGTNSYGIYNDSSSPTVQNSVLNASGGTNSRGIYNVAASGLYTVTVNNSQVTGSTNTIRNDNNYTLRVGASLLNGGAVNAGGGTVTCAGVYDEAYAFYASTCP